MIDATFLALCTFVVAVLVIHRRQSWMEENVERRHKEAEENSERRHKEAEENAVRRQKEVLHLS